MVMETDFLGIHLTVKSRMVRAVSSARKVGESPHGTQTDGTGGSKSLVTQSRVHHPHLKGRRIVTVLRDVTQYSLADQLLPLVVCKSRLEPSNYRLLVWTVTAMPTRAAIFTMELFCVNM